MRKKLSSILLLFVFIAITATAQTTFAVGKDKTYVVNLENREVARVTLSRNKDVIKAVVSKQGQPERVYTKSLTEQQMTISVQNKVVFSYNNKSADFRAPILKNSDQLIAGNAKKSNWIENKNSPASIASQNLFSEDMKIFSAIRSFDKEASTQNFELAYVIVTSDESIYFAQNSHNYKISVIN
jgi:hypothetical protein